MSCISVYTFETFKFFFQFEISFQVDDMSWTCSLCQKPSKKDSMQRHMNSKRSSVSLTQVRTMPTLRQKCLQFRFQHPFISAISGMTGSGKTFWVQSLWQQSSQAIQLPPDCLVLFTMVACLSGNSEHHTSNRICQRHSPSFRKMTPFSTWARGT